MFHISRTVAFCLFSAAVGIAPAGASTIVNGDFSAPASGGEVPGFTQQIDGGNDTDPSNLIEVDGTLNSDPFLRIRTLGSILGDDLMLATQTLTVQSTHTLFGFDIAFLGQTADALQAAGTDLDIFRFRIVGESALFDLTEQGGGIRQAIIDMPSRTRATDLNDQGSPVRSDFDSRFEADLSAFAGEEITIQFSVLSRPDGFLTDFGIDNVSLTSAGGPGPMPPAVPLPAGFLLLISGIGVLRFMRKP